jgi:hypothetical protein
MTTIKIGDKVRIYGTVTLNDVPTDPTTLTITITPPSPGVPFSYTWPTDPEVVRDAAGEFHYDQLVNAAGTWSFSWDADGAVDVTGDGEFSVGEPTTVKTIDDQATPADVPFVEWQIVSQTGDTVASGTTDENGESSTALGDGVYRLFASKIGFAFQPVTVDVIAPGPHTLTAVGTASAVRYLTAADLEACTSVETVDRLFHDDNSGVRNMLLMESVMREAEALADSRMLRGWTEDQITTLALNDSGFRCFVAWVALELATERRAEFISTDGKGRYWAQYERSIDHFVRLSKSKIHSKGERVAGTNANTGGRARPQLRNGQSRFVFADEPDGTGHGGF